MRHEDLRVAREERRWQENHAAILKAAEAVILRKGVSAATMDDVAAEAQFSKATLYHYFQSKGELVAGIFANFFDEMQSRLEAVAALPVPASEKLKRSILDILAFHAQKDKISRALIMDEGFMKKMGIAMAMSKAPSGTVEKRLLGVIQTKTEHITELGSRILAEGVAAGEFRPMNIPAAVTFLGAVVDGFCHGRIGARPKMSLAQQAELLYGFFMHGIQKTHSPRQGDPR